MTAALPTTTADAPAVVAMQTTGLRWQVGGFTIIDGIDLTVRQGEFLSIIGPNGAGKSSLLNLMTGVYRPTAGSIVFGDVDVTSMRPAKRVKLGLGRTFQTSSLFPGLSVLENARLAAQAAEGGSMNLFRSPRRGDRATRTALQYLEEVGMDHRAGDRVGDLPHGDKRKLEIALVLCGDPQVLLLDEPTAGVSVEEVQPLVDVVSEVHQRGRTVVMVEHRMDLVVGVSDRIAVIHQGQLLRCDRPEAVMADEQVREAYLGSDW